MSPRKSKKRLGRQATPSGLSAGAESEVLTLQGVADYLHCHYGTAFKLAHRGDIPGFRLGGGWRFLKSDVDRWIAKGGGRQPSEEPAVKPRTKARKQKPAAKRPAPRKGRSRK
jgi:excisionase family DNA binding protein